MIILVHGNDIPRVIHESHMRIESLKKRRPDATVVMITSDSYDSTALESVVYGQGLFDEKVIVHLNRILENKEAHDTLGDFLDAMQQSPNGFVVTETKLNAKWRKVLLGAADHHFEHDTPVQARSTSAFIFGGTNIYSIVDAYSNRGRAKFWELLVQAKEAGAPSEMVHSILVGRIHQALMILTTKKTGSSLSVLGFKPQVARSAESTLANYSEAELKDASRQLLALYHEARSGGDGLWVGLEKFALDLT